jgi:hypothetical protein
MRHIARSGPERLKAGLLFGLLAYVLLLQGLTSSYAKTLMTTGQFDTAFVICAPSGQKDILPVDPLEQVASDCCVALCKAASSAGPATEPPSDDEYTILPLVLGSEHLPATVPGLSSRLSSTTPEARAPPLFSA